VDGGWIYAQSQTGVFKCPVTGCVGSPIAVTPPLTTDEQQLEDFAIDANYVWYAVGTVVPKPLTYDGKILKAPK
jgi:hypothetical protein